jgi:hypothetical protein
MKTLVNALAEAKVPSIVASFLFLRWGVKFSDGLAFGGWSARAMRRLYTQKVTDYCGGGTIWIPPLTYRAERFAALGAMTSARGLRMTICRCKNADAPTASCCHPDKFMMGALNSPAASSAQTTLF